MLRGVIDTQYKGGTYLTLEAYLKRGGADPGRHTPQYQPYLSTNGLHAKGEQLHTNAQVRISLVDRIDDTLYSCLC